MREALVTPSELRQIGELLYGERWQTQLAKALDVNERNVRYWLAERHAIPEGIEGELKRLADERRKALAKVLKG